MFSNEAFARTAERYMDTIYRVAYGWLKNPDDANDVTQDVLIELYKTEKAFESDAHLKNWLIRATVNRCKMLFRSPEKTVSTRLFRARAKLKTILEEESPWQSRNGFRGHLPHCMPPPTH